LDWNKLNRHLNHLQSCLFALTWLVASTAQAAEVSQEKGIVKTIKPKQFSSVAAVLKEYQVPVQQKLGMMFAAENVTYPPKSMTWICLKAERQLMLFAEDSTGRMHKIYSYPIIGTSGKAGPKLQEGDKQVPEGFYKISGFRPNLIAHMGLSVNYPNATDRLHAKEEKRHNLGSDILIHGSRWSTGCLAMGNEPIEELFVLAYDTGIKNISLIFAPYDLTKTNAQALIRMKKNSDSKSPQQPKWLPGLYLEIRKALLNFPLQPV
jgi:murein L,D-transpeptidase YafK